jgi:hypothetical protein
VALSVDGLNTLDSRHTAARDARKWVLAPYETVVIPGWQVSNAASRKFVFTGERASYGAALGKTQDLGVIEAVFFRERVPYRVQSWWRDNRRKGEISSNENMESAPAAPASPGRGGERDLSKKRPSLDGAAAEGQLAQNESSMTQEYSQKVLSSDEYAATGMGRRTQFGVTEVDLDLEAEPAAVVRLRYEFRPQLVALGVLPRDPDPSRLTRREHARGFEEFCPEVR